jgi:hypothetical protein
MPSPEYCMERTGNPALWREWPAAHVRDSTISGNENERTTRIDFDAIDYLVTTLDTAAGQPHGQPHGQPARQG